MTTLELTLLIALPLLCLAGADRWKLSSSGGIKSELAQLRGHSDHMEMGGQSVNAIVQWTVSPEGQMSAIRKIRWPMIRMKKDDTHASLEQDLVLELGDLPRVDGGGYQPGSATSFAINGMLSWTEAGLSFQ